MREALGRLEGLHVADRRRRPPLARRALARPGARARRAPGPSLVGPPTLVPRGIEALGCEVSYDIAAIADADVVYVLRMQHERMGRGLRAVAPRVHGAVRDHAGARARRAGRHASGPDEPRRRDRSARRRLRRRARHRPGARPGSSCGWRCSTTCSPSRRSRRASAWRSPDARRAKRSQRLAHARRPRAWHPRRGSTRPSASRSRTGSSARSSPGEPASLIVAPAFVDPHVHLRTPGREDEETIRSGTEAAAAGGYCAILAMPNTEPVVDSAVGARSARRARARGGGRPDRLHGGDQQGPARRGADRDGGARREPGRRRSPTTAGRSSPPGSCAARSSTARSRICGSRSTARSRRSRAAVTRTRARSPPSSGSARIRRPPRA